MIHKVRSPKPGHVRVIFELPASMWADRVFVTGDFNNWDKTDTPLHQDRNGVWRATLDLRAGVHYEFRYLIDGQWSTDYHADGCTTNPYGSQNSIVIAELAADPSQDERTDPAASRASNFKIYSGGATHDDSNNQRLDAAA